MTLTRKDESRKEFKIFHGVFDERSMMNLYQLLGKNGITAESIIKEGKESVILSGLTHDKQWVAIKVYCTKACNFKALWKYLMGDPRFKKIGKNIRKIVNVWCQREFKNLRTARWAGVNCPKPLFFRENALIMEFIGENNIAAPRLTDITPEYPNSVYKEVISNLEKLVKAGLVHGDLSAYNILFYDKTYFIDFSHGTTLDNEIAPELLKRDIKNINYYFSKLNVNLIDDEELYNKLIKFFKKK
jgi:RIO kinase 1